MASPAGHGGSSHGVRAMFVLAQVSSLKHQPPADRCGPGTSSTRPAGGRRQGDPARWRTRLFFEADRGRSQEPPSVSQRHHDATFVQLSRASPCSVRSGFSVQPSQATSARSPSSLLTARPTTHRPRPLGCPSRELAATTSRRWPRSPGTAPATTARSSTPTSCHSRNSSTRWSRERSSPALAHVTIAPIRTRMIAVMVGKIVEDRHRLSEDRPDLAGGVGGRKCGPTEAFL